jgi:hypothetical protein
MMPEREDELREREDEAWPTSGDPDRVAMAFAGVLESIIETVPEGSARRAAMCAVMEVHGAVRAMLSRQRFN